MDSFYRFLGRLHELGVGLPRGSLFQWLDSPFVPERSEDIDRGPTYMNAGVVQHGDQIIEDIRPLLPDASEQTQALHAKALVVANFAKRFDRVQRILISQSGKEAQCR